MMNPVESFTTGSSFRYWLIGVALLLLPMSAQVMAKETPSVRLSQSLGIISAGMSAEERERLLNLSPPIVKRPLTLFGSRTEAGVTSKGQSFYPMHNGSYRIYSAESELSRDDDEDGFYHRLRVSFDADVDYGDAYVYAKLFLSYEGGPWNHYFTTDVFHILEDVAFDDYVVVTRLLENYPSGYYDVLIELYDADLDEHVASYGPYENVGLSALPLEDQLSDYPHHSSESHGGGGGLSWLTLCLIALGWIIGGDKRASTV